MTTDLDSLATALYAQTDGLPKESMHLARWPEPAADSRAPTVVTATVQTSTPR
ncbi:hypothetical protein [Streptomyces sp. NPDC101165]|uniref:hypothetical protein n=1 Tax=Streptomyces sp. NPDC101165 TaxID=3366119 RepID=UPI0037FB0A27